MTALAGLLGPKIQTLALKAPVTPLREDLNLLPAAPSADGSPCWSLHDPVVGRFYRIGWVEFEMLSRWRLGSPENIARAVSTDTTAQITADDVMALMRFLSAHRLLNTPGSAQTEALLTAKAAQKMQWGMWLLKNYLFLKVPLVRPDPLLERLKPHLGFMFSSAFIVFVLALAATGAGIIAARWDSFVADAYALLSPTGAIAFFIALVIAKCVHEMGHGVAAKHYGCRVPSMGVALLVLFPMLWTDTTDAWRLTSRRQRLVVDSAGMMAELILASVASIVWALLDPGFLKSVAHVLAGVTWIMTLVVNLNPLMRFDGYFVMSDALDIPNLQDRSFALGRWYLRRALFGNTASPPEQLSETATRGLVFFAFAVWVYRFFLFLGIALLVYHFFFKVLGIFLMIVEVHWFIVRPIWSEISVWWKSRETIVWNANTKLTAFVLGAGLFAILFPWRSDVHAVAQISPVRVSIVSVPESAIVTEINVGEGQRVRSGDVILRAESPDLEGRIRSQQANASAIDAFVRGLSANPDEARRAALTATELQTSVARLNELLAARESLVVRAAHDGVVHDVAPWLRLGAQTQAREPIAAIVDDSAYHIETFVEEAELELIEQGGSAHFIMNGRFEAAIPASVTRLQTLPLQTVTQREFTAEAGGPIETSPGPDGELLPRESWYRVTLSPDAGSDLSRFKRQEMGRVVIEGRRQALLFKWLRAAWSTIIMESGF